MMETCDGYMNRPQGEDELNCDHGKCPLKGSCPFYHFQCDDLTCISDVHLCDGEIDCKNSEDERECGCNVKMSTSIPQDYLKCPSSYCLPWNRVCNGITDCLNLEDETMCHVYACEGMLHCKGQTHCVPMMETCDGYMNCPQGEDELNCDHGKCQLNCTCQNYAVW